MRVPAFLAAALIAFLIATGVAAGAGFGSRTLRSGHSGPDVTALQWSLARHGFPSRSVDGGFGARTEAALRRYQTWAGLWADGVAGPATFRSLRSLPVRSPIWLLPPVRAGMTDRFGPRGNKFHTGVDYPAPTGTAVTAAGRGRVVFAGWDAGGYGNTVVIEHPLQVRSMYAHLAGIAVSRGAWVVAGNRVGTVGATGWATGPHLHFELRLRGASLDPLTALR